MTKTALIVGGGIAGPVAALALQRAGWQPRIFEAYPAGAYARGVWLTVAVNGLAALRALDLDPARVVAAGHPTPQVALTNSGGGNIAVLPLGGPADDGTVTTTIRRADLYGSLRAAVEERGIPIEHGCRLADFAERPDGVTITLSDGRTVDGELLVGADGLHSRTRELLNPGGPSPRYLGLLNAGGFTDGPFDIASPPGMMHMMFGRRAFFGWTKAPGGDVWWFANPPRKQPVRPDEFTPASWRDHLIELFQEDAGPAAAIIRASAEAIGPWNTDDLPKVPVWHTGRAVLVGDAAHAVSPSSGQGASMAIEDAVTLGRCLSGDAVVPAGLADYEQRRRARVEKVVAYGRRSGSGKTAGPIVTAMMPLIFKMLHRKGDPQAWILNHRV